MYTQIEDSNTTHSLLLSAHACPVGTDDVCITYTVKVTEHDYVTRYCAISITIDRADDTVSGIVFAAVYKAHRAFLAHEQHILLNPNEPNTLLQYLLHKLPHGNALYNKAADCQVKTWADYKDDTQLSAAANDRIDALMELELTDEPIVPVEVTGKTEAGLSADDLIPDSGYDGLYS